jgi:hypothetical protein
MRESEISRAKMSYLLTFRGNGNTTDVYLRELFLQGLQNIAQCVNNNSLYHDCFYSSLLSSGGNNICSVLFKTYNNIRVTWTGVNIHFIL